MIVSYLLQELSADKPRSFTRFGGTMRYYMYKLGVSQSDWLTTIDYAIGRGWVEPTGQIDSSGPVYNWTIMSTDHWSVGGKSDD